MFHNRIFKLVRRLGGKILYLAAFIDHVTASNEVMLSNPNVNLEIESIEKICIFASYNFGNFPNSAPEIFKEIESLGFKIIHVDNIDKIDRAIQKSSLKQRYRKNLGYDLAAIRDGLGILFEQPKELLIINDSVIYFKGGISRIIERAKEINADVVGLTESLQKKKHLQSYFFYSNTQRGIDSLIKEFEKMRNWRTKRAVVVFGELQIMSNLEAQDVKCAAVVDYRALERAVKLNPFLVDPRVFSDLSDKKNLNPTQHLWKVLFFQGIPMVKKSLIRTNPAHLWSIPNDYKEAEEIFFSISANQE